MQEYLNSLKNLSNLSNSYIIIKYIVNLVLALNML